MNDYTEDEIAILRNAHRVFFPTIRFVDVFESLGIATFPNSTTYHYQRSRIFQQLLLDYLDWPHPRTRIYFGNQKRYILEDFQFPLYASGPKISQGSYNLVQNIECLREHAQRYNPIIIQEAVEWTERLRLVYVQYECLGAWHLACGHPEHGVFQPLPLEASHTVKYIVGLTHRLLQLAQLDDILVEWGNDKGNWKFIQMQSPPSHLKTAKGIIERHDHICNLIQSGIL
jgi:hypothetical protein